MPEHFYAMLSPHDSTGEFPCILPLVAFSLAPVLADDKRIFLRLLFSKAFVAFFGRLHPPFFFTLLS